MWTDRPEHDAAQYDIDMRREARQRYIETDYPICEVCGDRIEPGEEFFQYEDLFFHRDCVTWRVQE